MLWIVRSAKLRVPWGLAAASVLEYEQLPDGSFHWVVDSLDNSKVMLRLLPGVLSVRPLADTIGKSDDIAA